jgi:hypothetical protein
MKKMFDPAAFVAAVGVAAGALSYSSESAGSIARSIVNVLLLVALIRILRDLRRGAGPA